MNRSGIDAALDLVQAWESRWGERPDPPAVDAARWAEAWEEFERRMGGNYPFFHPRFAGQMLKPPHPVAAAGYVAAMLVNPNNHALDGGPATSEMEKEAVVELAAMLGLDEPTLGHLTSSGTIANLEALWVARELHPDKGVVYGENAHYTHERMCEVLRMPGRSVPAGPTGRIDLDAVDAACARGDIGTVVLTAGTTGLGAVDRIDEALALRERHGVRIHVDAAYGGFFTLLEDAPDRPAVDRRGRFGRDRPAQARAPTLRLRGRAVRRSHRRAPLRARVAVHLLHLGRAAPGGDQPRVLTRRRGGRGTLVDAPRRPARAGPGGARRAALAFADQLRGSDVLRLHLEPELDIVTYLPPGERLSDIDAAAAAMLRAGMDDPDDPVFLSTLQVAAADLVALHPDLVVDAPAARILRSVLMKPEHEAAVPWLASRVQALARATAADARTPPGG